MKKILQVKKSVFVSLLLVFLMVFINSVSAGEVHFKMTAPKTTLAIGEEVLVTVSAWVDDPVALPDNGLDTWQLDLSVDNTGIIEITKTGADADITLLAPDPDMDWSGWNEASVNSPTTGEVRGVGVVQQEIGAPSLTGVGGYSDIFTFNIKGLAEGTAVYTICDDTGGGFLAYLADNTLYMGSSIIFDEGSSNTFTVVPEPVTFTLFALAGIAASFRKNK